MRFPSLALDRRCSAAAGCVPSLIPFLPLGHVRPRPPVCVRARIWHNGAVNGEAGCGLPLSLPVRALPIHNSEVTDRTGQGTPVARSLPHMRGTITGKPPPLKKDWPTARKGAVSLHLTPPADFSRSARSRCRHTLSKLEDGDDDDDGLATTSKATCSLARSGVATRNGRASILAPAIDSRRAKEKKGKSDGDDGREV